MCDENGWLSPRNALKFSKILIHSHVGHYTNSFNSLILEIYILLAKVSILLLCGNPLAGIDKDLDPWSDLIVLMVSRIITALPWEHSALWVWHHSEVTTIG